MKYGDKVKQAQKTIEQHDILIRDAVGRGYDQETEKIASSGSKLFSLMFDGEYGKKIEKTASSEDKRGLLLEAMQREAIIKGAALEVADMQGETEEAEETPEKDTPPLDIDKKKKEDKDTSKKKETPPLDIDKKKEEKKEEKPEEKKASYIERFLKAD